MENPNTEETIKSKIFTIREVQVMLDSDLAELYGVSTKNLNKAVKRNIERFPSNFMFRLNSKELKYSKSQLMTLKSENSQIQPLEASEDDSLRFQIGTSNKNKSNRGGKRYQSYAFTEQGVAMLSSVLRSQTAINVSIQIINTFVAMRKFLHKNAEIFQRLDSVERKQIEYKIETDKNFKNLFEAIQNNELKPNKGIFFEGQVFEAYKFVSELVKSAKTSIILIDNYINEEVLTLFTKRNEQVKVTIYTKLTNQLNLDLKKFNSQYPQIQIQNFSDSHDRFLIIDDKEVYHFGASLKDLGKKWFAFSKFDKEAFNLLEKIKTIQ